MLEHTLFYRSLFMAGVLTACHAEGADFFQAMCRRADFRGADLVGANFVQAECTEARFEHARLEHIRIEPGPEAARMIQWSDIDTLQQLGRPLYSVDLGALDGRGRVIDNLVGSQVTWRGAVLSGSRLSALTLVDCDLQGADFRGASIDASSFTRCDLNGTRWDDAQINQVAFTDCQLQGSRWPRSGLALSALNQCDLSAASFVKATLHRTVLASCTITGLSLRRTTFTQSVLVDTDFSALDMFGFIAQASVLRNARFTGMDLRTVKLTRCLLKNPFLPTSICAAANCAKRTVARRNLSAARWDGIDLSSTLLLEATLTDIEAADARCEGTLFQSATLLRVSLPHARASASVWDHARLQNVDLSDADLRYARFDHATGSEIDLSRANMTQGSRHKRGVSVRRYDQRQNQAPGWNLIRAAASRSALTFLGDSLMFAASRRNYSRNRSTPHLSEAIVHEVLEDNFWRLDDGRCAQQATSCLITPQAGDRVLLVCMADDSHYLLQVLTRKENSHATLAVPGADRLSIQQRQVDVSASKGIALRAMENVEVTALRGPISLTARNIFTSAADSLVQTARSCIGQVDQFLITARQLMRLHSEQTIVTARQDAKIDAERISLG